MENGRLKNKINYLTKETTLKRIKVFCAEENNTIIGNITLIIIPKSPKPNHDKSMIGYITNTYVKAEFRNCGIGSNIITNIKKYAKSSNIELLFTWPSETSVDYYSKNDFHEKNDIMECLFDE